MKLKKLIFIFSLILLSTITMVGCSEDHNQGANDSAHGHSH